MHTEKFGEIPSFSKFNVPNTPAGSKIGDAFGNLDSVLSTYSALPGATANGWSAVYAAAMTIYGALSVAASGKTHGNA